MSNAIPVVVSTHRSPTPEQQELHEQLVAALGNQPGFDLVRVPHLYDLEPLGPAARYLQSLGGDLIVLAWLPVRPIYWVLDALGIRGRWGNALPGPKGQGANPASGLQRRAAIPDRTIWCFDLHRHEQPAPYLEALARIAAEFSPGSRAPHRAMSALGGPVQVIDEPTRPRWYPVLDLDQCGNCKQCLSFCLFGVYGLDGEGRVVVEQPDACRPGCPACARICPHGAIMFPQHADPALAGDPSAPRQPLSTKDLPIVPAEAVALLSAQETTRPGAGPEPHAENSCSPAEGAGRLSTDLEGLVDGLEELEL